MNKIIKEAALMLYDDDGGELIGVVHYHPKLRERLFYSVRKMDEEEIENLFNKKS